jgi:hypothetical protein
VSASVIATTKGAIYRGETTNGLGDKVDDNTTPVVGLAGFPIGITERSRRVQDPASGIWRTVRYKVGRPLDPSLAIEDGDRLKDLTTGNIYVIDEITRTPRTIAGGAALLLDLRDTNDEG